MNRLDRSLGILLLLRRGQPVSAADLSRRFEVSPRTVYRDIAALAELGVPVYAEMGRAGGFRLMEGYFLPPVMFSVGEAVSLLLGLTFLRRLRAKPFAAELETAGHKLLAAVPDHLRAVLARAERIVGFESVPHDIFHPEMPEAGPAEAAERENEGTAVQVFLQAILDRRRVTLRYRSPYRDGPDELIALPAGILWDRGHWYLAGQRMGRARATKLWRADRVLAIRPHSQADETAPPFDVGDWLDRKWLRSAMARWTEEAPVTLRLTTAQAERLKTDWYYRHAHFEDLPGGGVRMTFGEDDREKVFELLRWLGPGAELLVPRQWRAAMRADLSRMLEAHTDAEAR